MSDIPLILFAKVPQAGQVKTRLTPELSFEQAKEVAQILLEESLSLATTYWPGKVVLAVWPNLEDDFIQQQLSKFNIESMVQVEGDLGTKMFYAMESVGYPSAVMGCDVPHLSPKQLISAHQALVSGQPVIGPTYDGGYYLLGLQASSYDLFMNKEWGHDTVLHQSQNVANQQGIDFIQLDKIDDIDTYADLIAASSKVTALRKFVMKAV